MSGTEKKINCPKGVPPASQAIGKPPIKLRWQYTEGKGKITDITGLPQPIFTNGRPDGSDFVYDYNGSTGTEVWKYQLKSDPPPPSDPDRLTARGDVNQDPELTNGPG